MYTLQECQPSARCQPTETDGRVKGWQRACHNKGAASNSRHGRLEVTLMPPEPEVGQAVQASPTETIKDRMMHSGPAATLPQDEMSGEPVKKDCGLRKARRGSVLHV
jgi:hypothetical protein